MSELLTTWNRLGDAWLAFLVERSLVGAVALGVVLAVIAVMQLRGRVSAHLPSWLLLVPLLVLVVPVERLLPPTWTGPLPTVTTLAAGDAGSTPAPPAAPSRPQPLPPSQASYDDAPPAAAEVLAAARPPLRWTALALAAWSLALAFGIARLVRRQRAAQRLLGRRSQPAPPALQRRFTRLARVAGTRPDVGLRLSPGLASPLVAGIRRPTVYVPTHLAGALAPEQLDFALRHELEHVRRRDVLVGAFAAGVRLAFWFHPGAWLATALHARYREYACDEAALARAVGRRTDIADTLFTLVERACGQAPPAPANALLLSPRHFMRTRLLRILDPQRRPQIRMSAPAATLLALATLGTLTAARPQQDPPDQASAATSATAPDRGPVATALAEGTAWLLHNQQPDGGWAIGPDPAGKNQRDHNPVCVTAMAVLALLPGIADEGPEVAEAVRRAVTFLEHGQEPNGRFGPEERITMMYAHAWTLRALSAVQRKWPHADRLQRLERGVAYALKVRNPYMGWRYGPRDGDNDSKITSTMLLGLQAAKDVGVEVEPSAIAEATALLDQLTDPETGRTGYVRRGEKMSRFTTKKDHFPGELSEEPTALRLLVRAAAGENLEDAAPGRRGVALIEALPPEWDEAKGSIDLTYWQFGAEVMAIVGGEEAAKWRAMLHGALLPNRIVEDGRAHWPAVDAWSHPGMEVYTTASAMLALRALR